MRASDLMNQNFPSFKEDHSLEDARQILLESSQEAALVSSQDGEPLGFLTLGAIFQVDFLRKAGHMSVPDNHAIRIRDILVRHVVEVEESASLIELSRSMVQNKVNRILVRKQSQVSGLITANDVLRAVVLSIR